MAAKTPNAVPELLDTARLSLSELAERAGAGSTTMESWRLGVWRPSPEKRAALVKAVRDHARRLLTLADKVEREGRERDRRGRKSGRKASTRT